MHYIMYVAPNYKTTFFLEQGNHIINVNFHIFYQSNYRALRVTTQFTHMIKVFKGDNNQVIVL